MYCICSQQIDTAGNKKGMTKTKGLCDYNS